MIPLVAIWAAAGVGLVRRRDQWADLTQRGGWQWKFSRLDVLFYGYTLMTLFYLVGMAILRTSETTERMRENTVHMADVVEKTNESTEQAVRLLAAMRAQAVAARAETAAAQRLALWVGVGTALLGAILGGFAGAFAARIIN